MASVRELLESDPVMGLNLKILYVYNLLGKPSVRTYVALFCIILLDVQMFVQVFTDSEDLQKVVFNLLFAVAAFSTGMKAVVFLVECKQNEQFFEFAHELIEELFQDGYEHDIKILNWEIRFATNYTNFSGGIGSFTALMFDLYTFIFSDENGKRQLIYDTWAPYDQHSSPNYELTCAFHVFGTAFFLFLYVVSHNLVILTLRFGATLYRVMENRLNEIFVAVVELHELRLRKDPDGKKIRELEAKIDRETRDLVRRHVRTLEYIDGVESFLSYNMGLEFGCFAIIICTEMFTISLMDGVTQLLVMMSFLFFCMAYSFMWNLHAEMVRSQSEHFCQLLYMAPWELADRKMKFTIRFMLMHSQRPVVMSILRIFAIGLDRFVHLVKTSYSYFTLLQTIHD